jgi:hypothetical protein
MKNLSSAENYALGELANALKIPRDALYTLINFESGFNPEARNPYTGARGLIQFMPATARAIGFASADELIKKNPRIVDQLKIDGPVYKYLKMFSPFTSEYDLFMAVFYPKARRMNPLAPFPANIQKVNPGIITPWDYVRKAYLHSMKELPAVPIIAGAGAGLLIVGLIIAYLLYRKGVFNI